MSASRREFLELLAGCAVASLLPGHVNGAQPAAMRTRPIPSSGEELPVIGMGTWQTFDVGPAESERAPLLEVLRAFFDAGGSVIDSSPMYGASERVVGDLLARLGRRPSSFLATKVWTRGRDDGIRQMNTSFELFRVQRMDLMQVHNLLDWSTHVETLRAWKEEGRIRYIGVTHYRLSAFDELERIIRSGSIDFVQLPYSIGVRRSEQRLLPAAADHGVAVLVMRPFEGGSLFGRVRGKPVPEWAGEFDCHTWAQFFLKFILVHPAVTCPLPATSDPAHMRDNVRGGFGRLPDERTRQRMIEHLGFR